MKTGSTSINSVFSNLITRSFIRMWCIAVLSGLSVFIVSLYFVYQNRNLDMAISELDDFRKARIDLGKEFLNVIQADSPDSPLERKQRTAFLRKAVATFEQIHKKPEFPVSPNSDEFRSSLKLFESTLNRLADHGRIETHEAIILRSTFENLEQNTEAIHTRTRKHLIELSEKNNRRYLIVLIFGGLLFFSACTGMLYAEKSREKKKGSSGECETHVCEDMDPAHHSVWKEQLIESENRLRFALEGSNDGLWDIQLKTGKGYLSPRSCEMLGYGPDEELWQNLVIWSDLIHPDDLDVTLNAFQNHKEGKTQIIQVEQRLKTKSGEWKWFLSRGKIVARDKTGAPLRATGTHTDISERKKLENQLSQTHKMEAIGKLAGGVAHDFNNMLGVILGNVEVAMETIESGLPPVDELAEIKRAAEHSVDLTRQLLAFARRQTIAPEILNLNQVVDGMLSMLRRLIGENIHLVWCPDPEPWSTKIDPAQVHQLLANLCVNARDAITHVGQLVIETGKTVFDDTYCSTHDGFRPGEYVLLAVSDNGSGMTKDTLLRIFEPFYTTKGTGKGTGLGLATVYGAVKQNNGFINVYSELGKGTTFKIYLPRLAETPNHANTKKEKILTPRGKGETILIVEDEPTLLALTTRILEKYGYKVLATSSPNKALNIAKEHPAAIDLLITDVVMPEMNCKELEEKINKLHPSTHFLFMSGYTENVIAHHGVLDSGVQFIQKPFSKNELAFKVREILDQPLNCL